MMIPLFETFLQDLRYALRTLGRSPAFTLAAVAILALGIGTNTAIFTVLNAALLRPPTAVSEPDQIVALYTSDYSGPLYGTSSFQDYQSFADATDVFEGVLAYSTATVTIGTGDAAEQAGIELVTPNFFTVLGAQPAPGRGFLLVEGAPSTGANVAVISHALWTRAFAASETAIGSDLVINGQPFTVVGVAPPGFEGGMRVLASDAWIPLNAPGAGLADDRLRERGARSLFLLGRLADGVDIGQAQSRMNSLAGQLRAAYPEEWTDLSQQARRVTILPEREARIPPQARGQVFGVVALLAATVGIVLFICCANVGGLLLGRASGRGREIAIRFSLGASRGRVLRQLLTEALLLSTFGAAAGLLLAQWVIQFGLGFTADLPVEIAIQVRPDLRVLVFVAAAAVLATVLSGIAPALQASRPDLTTALKTEAPGVAIRNRRITLRAALVVAQVTMSVMLLVGALLFVRSLRSVATIDPGFEPSGVVVANLEPPPGPPSGLARHEVATRMIQLLEETAGITDATWASSPPLDGEANRRSMDVDGYSPAVGESMEFHYLIVGPEFFETLNVDLVLGRGVSDQDMVAGNEVIVVNEAFANRFWPGENPLGKRIRSSGRDGVLREVVGIARDGKYITLTEEVTPFAFIPTLEDEESGATLLVRAAAGVDVQTALDRAREAVAPAWSFAGVRPLDDQIANLLIAQRAARAALSGFGILSLLLAGVGIYGVVVVATRQRMREIGIRLALGGTAGNVLRLVIRQALSMVGVGLVLGLLAALALAQLLGSLLPGVGAADPIAFLGAAVILLSVALLAASLPARRAAKLDPMTVLRSV